MTTADEYLRWCVSQIGMQEKPRGSNIQPYAPKAGHAQGQPWCASFLVAGSVITELALPPGAGSAYTPTMESAFKRAGRLSEKPRRGAFFFLYFPSMSRVAHVGVVTRVSDDGRTIWTVEGNSNSDGSREGYAVVAKKRPAHRTTGQVGVRSYGMPLYQEDDMADLTDAQIREIAKAVLNLDIIPNQSAPKGSNNPTWSLKSMVSDIEHTQDGHTETLAEHGEALRRIEGAITRGQAGIDYSALAKHVADELAARMKS